MSMAMGYDDSYARQNSPEGRAAIEAARAEVKAAQEATLLDELGRHADRLLPGSVESIAAQHGRQLGRFGDPARVAVEVSTFVRGPLASRYLRPAPEADALRQALDVRRSDFKSPEAMERFYSEHALEYAHAEPARAVEFVARATNDRRFRAYLKHEPPIPEATSRLVEALKPFDALLKGRLIDVAECEHFRDLAGPNTTANVKELTRLVEGRLKTRPAAVLLIGGEFDASKVARPAPAAVRVEPPERPAAEPTWEERNRAHFARTGL
jgi:hypothetical protein